MNLPLPPLLATRQSLVDGGFLFLRRNLRPAWTKRCLIPRSVSLFKRVGVPLSDPVDTRPQRTFHIAYSG